MIPAFFKVSLGAEEVVQLVKFLSSMHGALGLSPSIKDTGHGGVGL